MRQIVLASTALFALSATAVSAGEISRDTSDRVRQMEQRIDQLKAGKVGDYAREQLEAAKTSLTIAQGAGAGGNEKVTMQQLEKAELQLVVAEAKASEKELSEQVALSRVELKKLESQLEQYLQPEEK